MEVDGVPLNLKVLDEIVLDYAAHEELIWAPETQCPELASLRMKRETINHICSMTNEGQIEEAIALTRSCNASTLQDQKLLFQLYKQQLLEHLRDGSDDKAIQCARKSLEPLALNAYLEAYRDFKQVMLAFLYGPQDPDSPVAHQWSLQERSKLAGTVAGDLRAALVAYDPLLSLMLRYLGSIQTRFLEVAGDLPVSPRLGQVLREIPFGEKDPPLVPKSSLDRAPDFKEKDVQDLAHAVELPRQWAVDSLRVANGDVMTALKNELSRMRVNRTFLDELAREYLVYRGRVDCHPSPLGLSPEARQTPNSSTERGITAGVASRQRTSVEDGTSVRPEPPLQGSESNGGGTANGIGTSEGRPSSHGTLLGDDAGAAGRDQDGDVQMRDAQRGDQAGGAQGHGLASPPNPLPLWRGRPKGFRERHDRALGLHREHPPTTEPASVGGAGVLPNTSVPGGAEPGSLAVPASAGTSAERDSSEASCPSAVQSGGERHGRIPEYLGTSVLGTDVAHKYRTVLTIRDMASAGETGPAVDATLRLVPAFFADKPQLLFQLKQVEFVKLLSSGEYQLALRLARTSLGPLAASHRDLLPALKATLLAFAKPGIHHANPTPTPTALATELQESLAGAVGVPEPLLMALMRSLLDAHDEWFEMQMCEDPFRAFFKLDALKSSEGDADAPEETAAEGAEGPKSAGEQSVADESILTLMEFLAIPRSDAILLLERFDGSVEAVFADKLGGD